MANLCRSDQSGLCCCRCCLSSLTARCLRRRAIDLFRRTDCCFLTLALLPSCHKLGLSSKIWNLILWNSSYWIKQWPFAIEFRFRPPLCIYERRRGEQIKQQSMGHHRNQVGVWKGAQVEIGQDDIQVLGSARLGSIDRPRSELKPLETWRGFVAHDIPMIMH